MSQTEEPEKPIPKWAILPGRGKCRVLFYAGNGYFVVLTNRDVEVHVHRDRLTFTK